jgi:hypothetical protein
MGAVTTGDPVLYYCYMLLDTDSNQYRNPFACILLEPLWTELLKGICT